MCKIQIEKKTRGRRNESLRMIMKTRRKRKKALRMKMKIMSKLGRDFERIE